MRKGKKISREVVLLTIGILLFILTIGGAVYSIGFLSNNIFSALAPGEDSGVKIQFDLEGYRSLGLE